MPRSTSSTNACAWPTSSRWRTSTAACSSACCSRPAAPHEACARAARARRHRARPRRLDAARRDPMSVPGNELETVRDWLRWAVSRFNEAKLAFGHGSAEAYDEAAYLLLHALHLPLDRLDPFLDARLTLAERQTVAQLFARRIDERVPAAYLTHEAWLGDFRFYVDERVIIPRSFIAGLIGDGLAPFVGPAADVKSALDMCTGSGCL